MYGRYDGYVLLNPFSLFFFLESRGGLPVVDLRVEVTVEDVIEGKQSSSWEYPAWIARR